MRLKQNGLKWQPFIRGLFVLDIHTLERRWLKYKAKQYAPYAIGILTVLLLLSIFIYKHSDPSSTASVIETSAPIEKNSSIKGQIPSTETATVLEPSMEFIGSFQKQTQDVQPSTVLLKNPQPATNEPIPAPKVLNAPDSSTLKSPPTPLAPASEKPVSLNKNESKLDIDALERRFKESSNPNLGLFIARYHYDHGNYSEAYNYALKTNTLNNKIEESWIIFAKALVKLGKTDQAKKTLQVYIGESGSDTARSLLNTIEQGTFK